MTKNQLIRIIIMLLKTDEDLDFLLKLDEKELNMLTVCIRERVNRINDKNNQ